MSRTAAVWQAALAGSQRRKLELGSIGHDAGRLVLRFDRRLSVPPAFVREVLAPGRPAAAVTNNPVVCAEGRDARWEVDDTRPGTRVAFTAWIDADDVDAAAVEGAEHHRCFERLVRGLEQGEAEVREGHLDVGRLVEEYVAAFAAALADTD